MNGKLVAVEAIGPVTVGSSGTKGMTSAATLIEGAMASPKATTAPINAPRVALRALDLPFVLISVPPWLGRDLEFRSALSPFGAICRPFFGNSPPLVQFRSRLRDLDIRAEIRMPPRWLLSRSALTR